MRLGSTVNCQRSTLKDIDTIDPKRPNGQMSTSLLSQTNNPGRRPISPPVAGQSAILGILGVEQSSNPSMLVALLIRVAPPISPIRCALQMEQEVVKSSRLRA